MISGGLVLLFVNNTWGIIVQAIRSGELVEEEQHDRQEETLGVAFVGEDILDNDPDIVTSVSLPRISLLTTISSE